LTPVAVDKSSSSLSDDSDDVDSSPPKTPPLPPPPSYKSEDDQKNAQSSDDQVDVSAISPQIYFYQQIIIGIFSNLFCRKCLQSAMLNLKKSLLQQIHPPLQVY